MADWSTLPPELLNFISNLLPTSIDNLRFRSICSTWRFVTPRPPPPAFYSCYVSKSRGSGFSLSRHTVYSLQSPNSGPSWIIRLGPRGQYYQDELCLYHPLTLHNISFPPGLPKSFCFLNFKVKELRQDYEFDFTKVFREQIYQGTATVLNGLDGRFVVLAIHGPGRLMVYKSGDEGCRFIEDHLASRFSDVIVSGDTFYAIDDTGRTVKVNHVDLSVSVVANSISGGDKKSLLDCDGELFLVDKYNFRVEPEGDDSGNIEDFDLGYWELGNLDDESDIGCISQRFVKFEVFKLDKNEGKWTQVNDLEDMVFFFHYNCVSSASVKDVFVDGSCRGNCIFFTDDIGGRKTDYPIRVFDLGSGSVEDIANYLGRSIMFWPPPDWVYSAESIQDGMDQLSI